MKNFFSNSSLISSNLKHIIIPPQYTNFCCFSTTSAFSVSPANNTEEIRLLIDASSTNNDKNFVKKLLTFDADCIKPDFNIYSESIKVYTRLRNVEEGRMVHTHLKNSEFKDDAFLQISIMNMYCKCGSLVEARKMFDEKPVKDVVSFTALISGYAQNNKSIDALHLLPPMLRVGLYPNAFTFASLLKAAGCVQKFEIGEQTHALSLKCGCDMNVFVGSSLLDMYARYEKMNEASLVFTQLNSKNEVTYNALIAGYARTKNIEMAFTKYLEMKRSSFDPTNHTFSSMFRACASMGSMEKAKWIHAHLMKSQHKSSSYVCNILVDMYSKCGSIVDARKVFDRLNKKDTVSWNSMLTGYAQHGLGDQATSLFEEMLELGYKPNQISFLCVLTSCSHGGLLNLGEQYFDLMKKFNVEPEIEHYVTMVDLLGRAGQLGRAKKVIDELTFEVGVKVKQTAPIYKALLGACRMHKNAELGKFAADKIFELDPYDSGPHVLLYNIYASTGRWREAAEARKRMKNAGVRKEPACSWVELENTVHVFMSNEELHPEMKDIRAMWESIDERIKKAGYVPDTKHVLLYVDEEERAGKLQHHSEKLALAFALMKLPRGGTIRIMKNIRVCGDCHSAIKFVSEVMDREIVVRDTNRFHHFSRGSCSCGDYW